MCIVLILFSYQPMTAEPFTSHYFCGAQIFLFHFLSGVLFLSHLHYSSFVCRIPIKGIQNDGRQSSWDKKETATFVERMSLPAWALSHLIYFSSPCLCTSLFLSQPQLAPPHAAKSFCSITVKVAFVFRSLCLFICARGSRIPDCSPLCTRELFSFVLMSPCLTPLLLRIVRGFITPIPPDEKPNLSFIRKQSASQGLKAQDSMLPCNLERQMKCFKNFVGESPKKVIAKQANQIPSLPLRWVSNSEQKCTTVHDLTFASQE